MQHDHGRNFGRDSGIHGLHIEGLGAERANASMRTKMFRGGRKGQAVYSARVDGAMPSRDQSTGSTITMTTYTDQAADHDIQGMYINDSIHQYNMNPRE
jgi:hypothetical protein